MTAKTLSCEDERTMLRKQLADIRNTQQAAFEKLHERIRELEAMYAEAAGRLPEGSVR